MNFRVIVKNEFVNIISNKYVYVILGFFLINVIFSIFNIYGAYQDGLESWRIVDGSLAELSNLLSLYGGIVVLLIGYSSMTDEYMGHALNTLLAKPVYRDTIINGKLAGCMCFILCMFGLASALFISAIIVLCGNVIVPALPAMLERLPLVILFAILCAMIYFAIAMFIRILVRDNTAALLMIILIFTVIDIIMPNGTFTSQVGNLLGMSDQSALNLIAGFTPWWATNQIINGGLFSIEVGFIQVISNCWPEYLKLTTITVIFTVLGYIAFIRRDLA